MDLERASARAGRRHGAVMAASLAAALAAGPARAETLDAIAVENGSLVGDVNGRLVNARDLIGTTFSDGSFTYSIVDAASDPFLPGLWRYRVTWKAKDARDWDAVCRNSRGSTGWAYAVSAADGPRFVCEDTDVARCLAGTNGLTTQQALNRCVGG